MFHRRLKILLALLMCMVFAMVLRAAQMQLIQHAYWVTEAAKVSRHTLIVETTRGKIVDNHGRVLADDEPCIDACVDYRAVTDDPDDAWITEQAEARLLRSDDYAHASRSVRKQMIADECLKVRSDVVHMWATLAEVSGQTPDEIDAIRQAIVQRVEMRQRYSWYNDYEKAMAREGKQPTKRWYDDLLSDDTISIDDFRVKVAEQTEAHPILHAIDTDTNNLLAKNIEHYPGLELRPSKHRVYPFGFAACHVLGRLSQVDSDDLANDPNPHDELRGYLPNDLIGRGGIEGLCEQALRGTRGKVDTLGEEGDDGNVVDSVSALPGKTVKLTLDIELQSDILLAFEKRRSYTSTDLETNVTTTEVRQKQHGAAIVIDVASGQVLALVSYPGFDPNTLETDYPSLLRDDLNKPLMDRATQSQLEPGSTIKTVVGSAALATGVASPTSTIECTGYLVLDVPDGHGGTIHRKYNWGKCWVARQFEWMIGKPGAVIATVAHHPVPLNDPHPTGLLTVTDGLERSCNVQFETLAYRLGLERLSHWMDKFGLGRPTGIGIEEARGHIPDIRNIPASHLLYLTCFAGIGQGDVRATPIQMANVAATIARNGTWKRPTLLEDDRQRDPLASKSPTTEPATETAENAGDTSPVDAPTSVDLHIPQEALDAVKLGMVRVVNSVAGTGRQILKSDPTEPDLLSGITIAGKTGSAQAAKMTVPLRDANGNVVMLDGREQFKVIELGDPRTVGWYTGSGRDNTSLVHAWYIGFAPAEHPKIAFCVMVEYGTSGGQDGGAIAHDLLEACVEHGYLPRGDPSASADVGLR